MIANNLNIMKSLSFAGILFFLVIFVIGCNEDTAPTNSSSESQSLTLMKVTHQVSVGGADVCEALGLPTGCDANFSLVANMKSDGTVTGQWQDTFAGGGEGIHVAIDNMKIIGNGAILGGVITNGTLGGSDVTGQYAVTAVVDNGTSSNDQLGFSVFPYNGDFNTLTLGDFSLFDLTHGQVKVR